MRSDVDSGYGMFDKYDDDKMRWLILVGVVLVVVIYLLLPFHQYKIAIESFIPDLILSIIE